MEHARRILTAALQRGGIEPVSTVFMACPARAAAAGVALLAGGLCWLGAAVGARTLARAWRRLLGAGGLVCTGLALVTLTGGLDRLLPGSTMINLTAVVEPRGAARQEVLLIAHYDSKTEWLDHQQRGILTGAVCFAGVAALASAAAARGARRRRRGAWARAASRCRASLPYWTATAGLGLALLGAHLVSGKFLPQRSHGIVDDGAACALLVELARSARAAPAASTRLSFLWSAGEELGAQGSTAAARGAARETAGSVLNLECLGAGPDLAYAGAEWTGVALGGPDLELRRALAAATPGKLHRLLVPVVTDAGPWLRARARAITLLGTGPQGRPARGLHRPQDRRSAFDAAGFDLARHTVRAFLAHCDSIAAAP